MAAKCKMVPPPPLKTRREGRYALKEAHQREVADDAEVKFLLTMTGKLFKQLRDVATSRGEPIAHHGRWGLLRHVADPPPPVPPDARLTPAQRAALKAVGRGAGTVKEVGAALEKARLLGGAAPALAAANALKSLERLGRVARVADGQRVRFIPVPAA